MPPPIQIDLKGRIPAKKNQRLIFAQKGRLMNIPSKNFRSWHQLAFMQIKGQFQGMVRPQKITLAFRMPDNRRTDLSNKAESVFDLLVDSGVIPDDCWQDLPHIEMLCLGVIRDNPGVSITIFQKNS